MSPLTEPDLTTMQNLTAAELASWLADPNRPKPVVLDVRELWEVQTASLAGTVTIPMRDIPARSEELDDDTPTVCLCHHGARSAQVAMFLESRGHKNLYNLQGGIDAWSRQVDPSVPLY